jgi:hypothetical protein
MQSSGQKQLENFMITIGCTNIRFDADGTTEWVHCTFDGTLTIHELTLCIKGFCFGYCKGYDIAKVTMSVGMD